MKSMKGRPNPRSTREREAAEWVVKHASAEERLETLDPHWTQWAADPHNLSEYDETLQVVRLMKSQASIPAATDAELLYDVYEQPSAPPNSVPAPTGSRNRFLRDFRIQIKTLKVAAAAATILAVALFIFASHSQWLGRAPREQQYSTRIGEQQELRFADGSVVLLEGGSTLRVSFGKLREVYLDRGGARFRVAHNPNRPFVVHADRGTVRVLGTEFIVHRYSTRVRVWVTDGAVEVNPSALPGPGPVAASSDAQPTSIQLPKGYELTFDNHGRSGAPGSIDSTVVPDQIPGMFFYRNRPLSEVIEDIQRYTTRTITIDPVVADLLYSGSVFQPKVNQWIQSLPEIFPDLAIEERANAVIIRSRLSPRIGEAQVANP